MSNQMTVQNQQSQMEASKERKVFLPPVNVYENKEQIVLTADMPGVDEQSVEITLENNVLTIQGRSAVEVPQELRLAYAEYIPGDYRRSFTLSAEQINSEAIQASLKNGVLKIVLPKSEQVKPKKITVKVG